MHKSGTTVGFLPRLMLLLSVAGMTIAQPSAERVEFDTITDSSSTDNADAHQVPAVAPASKSGSDSVDSAPADDDQVEASPEPSPNPAEPEQGEPTAQNPVEEQTPLAPELPVDNSHHSSNAVATTGGENSAPPEPDRLDDSDITPAIYDSDIADMLPESDADDPAAEPDTKPASPEAEASPGAGEQDPNPDQASTKAPGEDAEKPRPIELDGSNITPAIYDSDFADMLPESDADDPAAEPDTKPASPEAEASPGAGEQDPNPDQASTKPPGEDAEMPGPIELDGSDTTPAIYDSDIADMLPESDADDPVAEPDTKQASPEAEASPGTAEKEPKTEKSATKPAAESAPAPEALNAGSDRIAPEASDDDGADNLPVTDTEQAEAEPDTKQASPGLEPGASPAGQDAKTGKAGPAVPGKPSPAPEPVTADADDIAPDVYDSEVLDDISEVDQRPAATEPPVVPVPPPDDQGKRPSLPPEEPPSEDAVWWQDQWIKPWEEDWIVEQEEWGFDGLRYVDKWGLLRMKLGGNFAIDGGAAWQQTELDSLFPDVNGWHTIVRNARLQLAGSFGPHIFFKAQIEMGAINPGVKDGYVVIRDVPIFSNVRFGKGKQPFSMENLTSAKFNSFMERSLLTALSPGRSFGIMAYDSAFEQRLTWAGGLFYRSASWGDLEFDTSGGADATARVTALPYFLSGDKLMHLGFGISNRLYSDTTRFASAPESRITDAEYVDTGDFAADSASTFNVEGAWKDGSWLLQGEYTRNFVRTEDGERTYSARYLQLGYFVTGESRPYNRASGTFGSLVPKRFYHWSDDPGGALELAIRLSAIDLQDQDNSGGLQEDITLGAIWYPQDNVRVMFNYVTGHVDATGSSPMNRAEGRFNFIQARVFFNF